MSCFLGLSKDDIDTIKENNPKNYSACWDEALSLWIKQNYNTAKFGAPSWRSLLKAIAPIDGKLFKELALKHQGMCMCEMCLILLGGRVHNCNRKLHILCLTVHTCVTLKLMITFMYSL